MVLMRHLREREDDVATWLYQNPVRSLVEATCPPIEKSPPDKKATKARGFLIWKRI
jgi:hypothetical protein